MKNLVLLSLVCVLSLFAGCRRSDIRELTISIPGLKEADKQTIVEALSKYSGVDQRSYQWDLGNKTLKLRYESMSIAEANIRYAIDEKGIKVDFPPKTDDRAGH